MPTTLTSFEPKQYFLDNFAKLEERGLSVNGCAWIRPIREKAIERFAALGFPTLKDEAWRQTNLKPLLQTEFAPVPPDRRPDTQALADHLKEYTFGGFECHRLVFVNGWFSPELSDIKDLPEGVELTNLQAAVKDEPDAVKRRLAQYADFSESPFVALNTAYMQDGAYLHVREGVELKKPIHLLFLSGGIEGTGPTMSHPRSLIVAEAGSRCTIVESYSGIGESVYFANPVTEVFAGESAVVDHYKVQQENEKAFHLSTLQTHQMEKSSFSNHAYTFGGRISRNDIRAALDGEFIETLLNGLYMPTGEQHMDTHSWLDHAKPNCHSNEQYKGILDEKGSGVFTGRILVRQDAQKTDAIQNNAALLLTDEATINSQPQLEIYADDVKCTHGATIGQIDEDAIFYLASRGVSEADARGLLTFAFANEIIDQIQVEGVRADLERLIAQRFNIAHLYGGTA